MKDVRSGVARRLVLGFTGIGLVVSACGKDPPPTPVSQARCQDDKDCVVSCDKRGECCKNPCSCEMVVHKAVAAANERYNAEFCRKSDLARCPDVGGCPPFDYETVPRCKAGACIAERVPVPPPASASASAPAASSAVPAPPPEPTVDMKGYDRACTKKEECRIVNDTPCSPCKCADKAIAAKELVRFSAAAAVECPTRPKAQCGECKGFVRGCENGTCVAKPE